MCSELLDERVGGGRAEKVQNSEMEWREEWTAAVTSRQQIAAMKAVEIVPTNLDAIRNGRDSPTNLFSMTAE
jgi:hypothetical protein